MAKMMGKVKLEQQTLKFTISSESGDGAYLCYEKVSDEIYEYFEKRKLDLEEYALDNQYAKKKKIPKKMEPFNPGDRAAFGTYECVMSVGDLVLTVETEDSEELFYGEFPNSNIKEDSKGKDFLKDKDKGIYAIGYEGLEDCYISGEFNVSSKSGFDIKKFKIQFSHIDYELGQREWISSLTYNKEEVDWNIDSYEGTGDYRFGFVVIK